MTITSKTSRGEVYMLLADRKKFARLVVVQELTHRQIAEAAGWKSHTYVGRLLRGEVNTVKPEAAVRIAHLLGVPLDEIFLTRTTRNSADTTRDRGRQSRQKVPA